ncbi:DUF6612 family protein [Laceyella sacchari]|jgi:hypothetical protein|uniref:Lipoprotein n=1 Tax=Laceyella sacchari TaxID=37482 RepID=A0ABY5U3W0_LACSH|nr:DUF6612 family protein [Laceyella sacchari]TCW40696.1 hypothetical protein EDC32_101343 [Laceyella sacchari]UWE04333.1 hypothetical protein NYR52_04030 [Laceyella sacchari]
MFNKRFAFILALMVPFSIFASGCGVLTGKKNEEAADKPLTATEVLTKSLQQLRKEKGHSIRVKYESTAVRTETNEENPLVNVSKKSVSSYEGTQDFTTTPLTAYRKGQLVNQTDNGLNVTGTDEGYYAEGISYSRMSDGWKKHHKISAKFYQKPDDTLQLILDGAGKDGKGLKMTKESGTYVITVDQTAGEPFQKEFYTAAVFSTTGIIDMSKVKTKSFEFKIWIDEKSFNYIKSTLKIKYDADLSTSDKTNQHLVDDQYEFIYNGPFTQTIQVPDEVKEKAIDM